MPRIIVRAFGTIRDILGSGTIQVEVEEDQTLRDVLDLLVGKYETLGNRILDPTTKRLQPNVRLLFNSKSINLPNDAKRKVKDGDVLAILPPVGGG